MTNTNIPMIYPNLLTVYGRVRIPAPITVFMIVATDSKKSLIDEMDYLLLYLLLFVTLINFFSNSHHHLIDEVEDHHLSLLIEINCKLKIIVLERSLHAIMVT
jgi:uncharacterized membrane protein